MQRPVRSPGAQRSALSGYLERRLERLESKHAALRPNVHRERDRVGAHVRPDVDESVSFPQEALESPRLLWVIPGSFPRPKEASTLLGSHLGSPQAGAAMGAACKGCLRAPEPRARACGRRSRALADVPYFLMWPDTTWSYAGSTQ